MNKTKIEWTDMSWNPVTGCKRGCPYCYAEKVAKRFGGWTSGGATLHENYGKEPPVLDTPMLVERSFNKVSKAPYPFDFKPTFHRYRLDEPTVKTKGQTIFVCSMADLFGEWVPTPWIVEVLDACRRAPQHRYLFLTKNPKRYIELDHLALLPREDNFWYGSTVTTGDEPMFHSENHNTFVSIEPILAPFGEGMPKSSLSGVDWFILGAETGNRTEKVVPEKNWIEPVVDFCKRSKKPLFMKDSMISVWGEPLVTEFPWEV